MINFNKEKLIVSVNSLEELELLPPAKDIPNVVISVIVDLFKSIEELKPFLGSLADKKFKNVYLLGFIPKKRGFNFALDNQYLISESKYDWVTLFLYKYLQELQNINPPMFEKLYVEANLIKRFEISPSKDWNLKNSFVGGELEEGYYTCYVDLNSMELKTSPWDLYSRELLNENFSNLKSFWCNLLKD